MKSEEPPNLNTVCIKKVDASTMRQSDMFVEIIKNAVRNKGWVRDECNGIISYNTFRDGGTAGQE